MLEMIGVIRTQTGSGPNAGAMVISTPSDGLSTLLRLLVAARGFPVDDIVSTRIILERAVVADLSQSDHDFTHAHQLLRAMDPDELTTSEFLAIDASFHVAVA